jgi:pilus assembly protein Flp/PilA
MNMLKKFVKDESGATAIEYGLIAALIAIAIIAGARVIGSQLSTLFTNIGTTLTTANSANPTGG